MGGGRKGTVKRLIFGWLQRNRLFPAAKPDQDMRPHSHVAFKIVGHGRAFDTQQFVRHGVEHALYRIQGWLHLA